MTIFVGLREARGVIVALVDHRRARLKVIIAARRVHKARVAMIQIAGIDRKRHLQNKSAWAPVKVIMKEVDGGGGAITVAIVVQAQIGRWPSGMRKIGASMSGTSRFMWGGEETMCLRASPLVLATAWGVNEHPQLLPSQ